MRWQWVGVWMAVFSFSVHPQILDEDVDDPQELIAFHTLCAATSALVSSEFARRSSSETRDERMAGASTFFSATANLHVQVLTEISDFSHDDAAQLVSFAMPIVRLLNNAGIAPIEERVEFLSDYCVPALEDHPDFPVFPG